MYERLTGRLAVALFVTVLLAGMASAGHTGAGEHSGAQRPSVGSGLIGSGSLFYGLDTAFDSAAMAIGLKTAGDVAQERAAEARAAAENGNNKAAEKAANQMSKVARKAKGSDAKGLQKAVSVLKEARDRAPQEAQPGLQNAIQNIQKESRNASSNETRKKVPPYKGKPRNDSGDTLPDDKVTIDPDVEQHIVGVTADGDVDAVKAKAENVTNVLDFDEIGKAVVGNFSVAALEELQHRDDVRYIEPDRVIKPPEPPAPANYTCPDREYIDCMPPVSEAECVGDYHEWIKQNCNTSFAY